MADEHEVPPPLPAESADATPGVNEEPPFIVPSYLAQSLPQDFPKWIPFYRPIKGHQLYADSIYAVRLNEAYIDAKAMLENERSYVRKAAIRAQQMWMYQCAGRQPVLIMANFEEKAISSPEARALDLAFGRIAHVSPPSRRIEVSTLPVDKTGILFRIVGITARIEKLAEASKPRMHFTFKPHHIDGLSIAHAYLFDGKLDEKKKTDINPNMFATMTLERQQHIISSIAFSNQVTIRHEKASLDDLFKMGKWLQDAGATCTIRTHGTLRATMPFEINPETFTKLREQIGPEWNLFSDTPLPTFAKRQTTDESTNKRDQKKMKEPRKPLRQQPANVEKAFEDQKLVFRIAADHLIHPSVFKAIADSYNGEVLQIIEAKFSEVPMAAIISIANTESNVKAWEGMCAEPFSIDDTGRWYATFIRPPVTSARK